MVIKILPQYFQVLYMYKKNALQLKGEQSCISEPFVTYTALCLQNIIMWRNEHFNQLQSIKNAIIIDDYYYYVSTTLPVTWAVSRVKLDKQTNSYTSEHSTTLSARMKVVLLYHLYLKGIG